MSSLTHRNIIHLCYPVFTFAILGSPIRFNASLRSWHFLFLSVGLLVKNVGTSKEENQNKITSRACLGKYASTSVTIINNVDC